MPEHSTVTHGTNAASACSRAYIRYACDDEELAVPSPTYTLLNTYKEEILEGPPIHHLDMYRLNSTVGQHRLQLPELWLSGATLIEWPERLAQKPEAHFTTQISTCSQVPSSSTQTCTACGLALDTEFSSKDQCLLQGDAVELQALAREWATGAAPEPPGRDPGGDDQRWRVLTIEGCGIDVQRRHEAGMRQLTELQIEPGTNRCLAVAVL